MSPLNEYCKKMLEANAKSRFPLGVQLSPGEIVLVGKLENNNGFGDLSKRELSSLRESENVLIQGLVRQFQGDFDKAYNAKLLRSNFDFGSP